MRGWPEQPLADREHRVAVALQVLGHRRRRVAMILEDDVADLASPDQPLATTEDLELLAFDIYLEETDPSSLREQLIQCLYLHLQRRLS
jgi:hypothetical protein